MHERMRDVFVIGDSGVQGSYLLRIHLPTALRLAFGRFRGGRDFCLPAGDYLYVGSAMGQRGATTLAARLLRHATRSSDRAPHPIREELLATLHAAAMAPRLPQTKRCRWHVDFLLDQSAVLLAQIYVLRTAIPLEQALAEWLMHEPATAVVVPGLGASDHCGATHLLRVNAPLAWWDALPTGLLQQVRNHLITGTTVPKGEI